MGFAILKKIISSPWIFGQELECLKGLRKDGFFQAALGKKKAAIAHKAEFLPVNSVQKFAEFLKNCWRGFKTWEYCQHRAIISRACVQKKRFGVARFGIHINAGNIAFKIITPPLPKIVFIKFFNFSV